MIENFTRAFIREIGRNYGKAASNKLLGDAHSTPYRRVGINNSINITLGAGSGGRNYENLLDKLISTFIIKGKVATFNSAQNIYIAFFQLVEEANNDGKVDYQETAYLIKQYYRTIKKLEEISNALIELDAKDKSQLVIDKMISVNEFMKSLDKNFERIPLKKNVISKSSIIYGRVIIFSSIILTTIILMNIKLNLYNISKKNTLFIGSLILFIGVIIGMSFINKFSKKKLNERNRISRIEIINKLKEDITKAANSISVTEVETN